MRGLLSFLTLSAVFAYYQPGVPPQCFDEYQCIYHRFPSETGLKTEYSWDLRSLCKGAGQEYLAGKDPACIVPATPPTGWTCPARCGSSCDTSMPSTNIRFNICGTVAGALAPVNEDDPSCTGQGGVNCPQELPIPHSHGIGIQYIEGYGSPSNNIPNGYGPQGSQNGCATNDLSCCADVDTCDQQWNPSCVPGSANYDLATPGCQSDTTCNYRAGTCANNPGFCHPYNAWCCSVKKVSCTKEGEIIAYYDGSAPNFNLLNEGNPNGISLSFLGALTYDADKFSCGANGAKDPSTDLPPLRSLTIRINCDKNAKTPSTPVFYEPSTCQYTVSLSSVAGCGKIGDPFNNPYTAADAFGFVVLGATLVGFCYVVWAYGEYKMWWEPIKSKLPDISGCLPVWLGGRGGVFAAGGTNKYAFVGSAGTAPAATPVSASAYGST